MEKLAATPLLIPSRINPPKRGADPASTPQRVGENGRDRTEGNPPIPLPQKCSRGKGGESLPLEPRARSPSVPSPFGNEDLLTASEQISAIRAEGPVAAEGIWIETGKVSRRTFRQAWYRSRKAIFKPKRGDALVKRKYLGKVGSPAHQEAIAAIARRNEINRLKKEMKIDED